MAEANSIAPFPNNINRVSFGHWLSGFADGEACFILDASAASRSYPTPSAQFVIKLRADDAPILHQIRSYMRCGICNGGAFVSPGRPGTKPVMIYRVTRATDLFRAVVAHFDRFPLRAKKVGDYRIWRQGVELLYNVGRRPRRIRQDAVSGRVIGTMTRWTDEERSHFQSLSTELRRQRDYRD